MRGQLESGNEHTERPAPRVDRPIAGGFRILVSYVELLTKRLANLIFFYLSFFLILIFCFNIRVDF